MAHASLATKLESPGFTPGARDVDPLFSMLADTDDEGARRVERALSRVGDRAARRAMDAFESSLPPLRARLCSLVGKVFGAGDEPELGTWLVLRLDDDDPKTRRRAASALGKTRGRRYEAPLLAAFERATDDPGRRALAKALGNVGGPAASARLSAVEASDAELARIVRESRVKIERTLLRTERGTIAMDVVPSAPTELLLHVRAGLEGVLLDELGSRWRARRAGRGRVALSLDRALRDVFEARTFVDVGFPLCPEPVLGADVAASVVRALASEEAFRIFSTFTRGPVRYRLEWAHAGRRRGTTFDVAARVRAVRPELVNDPIGALWEAVVNTGESEAGEVVRLELWPRGLADERFEYRKVVLPASSHPTTAAALARVAGVVPSDVVWDPFVGAGTELIERALLGPYSALYGSDTDPRALDAARENLGAASIHRFRLAEADARSSAPPERPSLVLTNPPFGRRVLPREAIRPLLSVVLENVATQLADGGRLVWASPIPSATLQMAGELGFAPATRLAVDLGGVPAEIQEFRLMHASKRGAGRRSRRKL